MLGSLFKIPKFLKDRVRHPRSRKYRISPPKVAPELERIWTQVASSYFPQMPELGEYMVVWSRRRQKRVLASITVSRKLVRVARELNHPDYVKYLEPLLYHEMCHAVVGDKIEKRGRKRLWHGPSFKNLENQHPDIKNLQKWIREGGWAQAIRRDRARTSKK